MRPCLSLIRRRVDSRRGAFSVCTGALICGAGRRSARAEGDNALVRAFDLLPFFGALPVRSRVVVDGSLITAAGVTAGIDGALTLAALLRGRPSPSRSSWISSTPQIRRFTRATLERRHAGVLETVRGQYAPLTEARRCDGETDRRDACGV